MTMSVCFNVCSVNNHEHVRCIEEGICAEWRYCSSAELLQGCLHIGVAPHYLLSSKANHEECIIMHEHELAWLTIEIKIRRKQLAWQCLKVAAPPKLTDQYIVCCVLNHMLDSRSSGHEFNVFSSRPDSVFS